MEESHYALHIALQTLKERCQQFQSRISTLEEENVNLRLKCCENTPTNDSSFNQIDGLTHQVTKLTEQKGQLSKSVAMVTAENRKLWTRLSKLTQRNETIGSKLNKINDSLSQHSPAPALIRSKTFTQESPQNKFLLKANYDVVDESDKISLELEDISLKLISSIAKEKLELEQQCSEMAEMQSNEGLISNSFTFGYVGDDVDNTVVEDMDLHLSDLKSIKELLATENRKLLKNLSNLSTVKGRHSESFQYSCHSSLKLLVMPHIQGSPDITIDVCNFPKKSLAGWFLFRERHILMI